MGSGGMIVMDEISCMIDVAKYFFDFTSEESCGRCNSCREGLDAIKEVLTKISEGEGNESDLEFLSELGNAVKDFSLCALGRTAPNPVLSTIRYFRDEYEAHIREKRCPALACKELTAYYIEPEKCQACLICLRECPAQAISGDKKIVHVIDQEKCTKCGTCLDICPARFSAVTRLSGVKVPEPVRQEAAVIRK